MCMGFDQHITKTKKVNQNRKEQVFLFYSRLWTGSHALGWPGGSAELCAAHAHCDYGTFPARGDKPDFRCYSSYIIQIVTDKKQTWKLSYFYSSHLHNQVLCVSAHLLLDFASLLSPLFFLPPPPPFPLTSLFLFFDFSPSGFLSRQLKKRRKERERRNERRKRKRRRKGRKEKQFGGSGFKFDI